MNSIRLLPLLSIGVLLTVAVASASTSDGTINTTNRYAWSENIGWVDFGTTEGNVHVTDSALTGYAWNETTGWISLNCSNTSSCATVEYKVTNNAEGTLGGNAWSENVGWIQFAPTNGGVTIDSAGNFSGYAWGENVGWIVFNCSNQSSCGTVNYKVATDWTPLSARSSSSSSSVASVSHTGGTRVETLERRQAEASAPSRSSTASTIPQGPQRPFVVFLINSRDRLLKRFEKRLTEPMSPGTRKMLEGTRDRAVKRIDSLIRSAGGD